MFVRFFLFLFILLFCDLVSVPIIIKVTVFTYEYAYIRQSLNLSSGILHLRYLLFHVELKVLKTASTDAGLKTTVLAT